MSNESSRGYQLSVVPPYYGSRPGIQVATHLSPQATDEYISFVKQLGLEWGMSSSPQPATVEAVRAVRERMESQGVKIFSMVNPSVHNMPDVMLNTPDRDAKVAEYLEWIRTLGAAGIHYTTFGPVANGIWSSSHKEPIRGGALARTFDLNDPEKAGHWNGQVWKGEITHGRVYQPGGDLGEFRVLYPAGQAGGRGGQRLHRHPPRRPAGARAGRRAAPALQQFRRFQARARPGR